IFFFLVSVALVGLVWSRLFCFCCVSSVCLLFWLSLFVPVTKKKDFFLGSCFVLSLVHPFFLLYYLYLRLLSLCFLYLRFVFFFIPRCLFFYSVIYLVISLLLPINSLPLLYFGLVGGIDTLCGSFVWSDQRKGSRDL
ncbi:hypothetical protein BDC45DRAFT_528209, partial [Circinella umbellata]